MIRELLRRLGKIRSPNCLFWGLAARKKFGGYLVLRESITPWTVTLFGHVVYRGKIPHVLWQSRDRKHMASFCPRDRPKSLGLRRLPMVLWFDGRVEWGDHASPKPFLPWSGSKRFLLLRVAALILLAAAVFLGGLAWWAWRIGRFVWWLWLEL